MQPQWIPIIPHISDGRIRFMTSRHGSSVCGLYLSSKSDVSVQLDTTGTIMRMFIVTALIGYLVKSGLALQIRCYQCEEVTHNDCSTPEFIVNCTVNVQDMCQKEVLVKEDGIHYRKSCASSGACLIASSGYQQFCTGRLNSVCISCCNTPLCNGPRQKRRPSLSGTPSVLNEHHHCVIFLSVLFLFSSDLCC